MWCDLDVMRGYTHMSCLLVNFYRRIFLSGCNW